MTRKEAINILENDLTGFVEGSVTFMDAFWMAVDALKTRVKDGHWIVVSDGYGDSAYICECSECKDTVWVYKDADRKWNYCPNCGAKMESEDKNGHIPILDRQNK